MAYVGYRVDINPDFDMGANVDATEGAIRFDPDASPPRLITHIKLKAASGSNRTATGTIYVNAEYTDGTVENLLTDDISETGISADTWYNIRSDPAAASTARLALAGLGATPWVAAGLDNNSAAYFTLSSTKTLQAARVDWRPT